MGLGGNWWPYLTDQRASSPIIWASNCRPIKTYLAIFQMSVFSPPGLVFEWIDIVCAMALWMLPVNTTHHKWNHHRDIIPSLVIRNRPTGWYRLSLVLGVACVLPLLIRPSMQDVSSHEWIIFSYPISRYGVCTRTGFPIFDGYPTNEIRQL